MQRREKEVRGGRERELEKVKEDRKCFEWVWLRRDSRRRKRRGRTEESGESVATNRVCGVNRKERLGGEEQRSKKEYNEDEVALAARLRPITLLLTLSSISPPASFSLCVLSSHFPFLYRSLTFPIWALTIHVLSAATDPYMIPVCTGRFYLPLLQ